MDKASLQPNPAGYRSLTPFVLVRGAAAFIEFLQGAFGAIESKRCTSPPPRWTARNAADAAIAYLRSLIKRGDPIPSVC